MRRVGWSLLVLALAFGIGEGLARLGGAPDPTAPAQGDPAEIMLQGNPYLLWELQPGDRVERGRPVHVNARGFRDRDRAAPTRPRALSLGDSSIYGFGVADEDVFTSRLEATMDADFIDGGVPGYSTWQALNLLDMRGLALEPDLLLVGTLWSDNNFDSFVDKDLLATYAGWQASTAGVTRALLDRSALFRWLDWELRVYPAGQRARRVGWELGSQRRTGKRRVAINDYAANLDALCDRMQARGGGVVFILLANREDVAPVSPQPAWGPYRQVMRDTAARRGAPIVELPELVRASGRSADALFLDEMHPSEVGHQLLADAVSRALTTAGWPAAPLQVHAASTPRPVYPDPFEGKGGSTVTASPDPAFHGAHSPPPDGPR